MEDNNLSGTIPDTIGMLTSLSESSVVSTCTSYDHLRLLMIAHILFLKPKQSK